MKDRPNNGSPGSGSWLERLTKILSGGPRDRQQIVDTLREWEERNLLDPDSLAMIEGALLISEMQVRDIMVPRVQMVVVKYDVPLRQILKIAIESGHSRFPVVGDDPNEVDGILLAKDLLGYFSSTGDREFEIKDIMRPAIFVPESKRLNVLLREFRISRNHMAIVVDEYSNVAGLVTIEDIIEEIVGDIEDEHDIAEEHYIRQHGRNRYTVQALTPIDEFNEYFKASLSSAEYDTIGGLVLKAFGHLPKRGETIDLAGFHIKVLRADKRRIHLLRVMRHEPALNPEEGVH
jgi:magnesium and cobalt transporter